MKWEDYYDRFWDWAESTKISRISSLTDFTSSAEVVEIANIIDKVVTVGFVDLLKMFLMVFQDIFERFAKEYILRPRSSMSCMRRKRTSIIASPPMNNCIG